MANKGRYGHAGTSIVEVLVAMVILVIGIFGIIRVFPTGFGIINYGEHVSAANKLTSATLERARSNSQNLPDAVIPMTFVAGGAFADATLTPGVEANDFQQPMPADPALARFYGFNRTRRIIGETTKIPAPSADVPYMPLDSTAPQGSTRRQLVSLYTLQYGPMDPQFFPLTGGLLVYSGQPMERVTAEQELTQQEATDLGVFRYGVTYQRDRIVLFVMPADYARIFKVQYSYTVADPSGPFRAQSSPGETIPIAAGAFRVDVPMPNGATPERGEEIVAQAFTPLTADQPFSERDPFQYKLLNDVTGIVGFNPLATLVQQSGTNRGLTAKIDYDVADWHVVSEDVTVPQKLPFRVKLTLNFLKRRGDVQDNKETYAGLLPRLDNIDVIVMDVDRGVTIDSRTLDPDLDNDNGAIDYRSGTLTFNPRVQWNMPPTGVLGPPEPIAGQHLRIYYRTEDDFGLQVQKAFTNYLRSANAYTVTPGQYGQERFGYLLFPASDHNQSVLVDYTYTERTTGRRMRVAGEMQPVRDPAENENPVDSPPVIPAFSNVPPNLWFVRLNNSPLFSAGDPNGKPEVEPGSIVVHSVRGVSMRSRALWREGNRWRRIETTTYLSRPGT